MAVNRGKKFENVIRQAFESVPNVSVDRLHDQTNGFKGSQNICDFIVYKEPYEYYIECKSVHGNTLSIHSNPKADKHGRLHGFYGAITDTQWEGLLEKSKIEGVFAGIVCWFADKNDTRFFPIQYLQKYRQLGCKSVAAFDESDDAIHPIQIKGKKKRVFYEYNMEDFFNEVQSVR